MTRVGSQRHSKKKLYIYMFNIALVGADRVCNAVSVTVSSVCRRYSVLRHFSKLSHKHDNAACYLIRGFLNGSFISDTKFGCLNTYYKLLQVHSLLQHGF
jgi:hypothetical protein